MSLLVIVDDIILLWTNFDIKKKIFLLEETCPESSAMTCWLGWAGLGWAGLGLAGLGLYSACIQLTDRRDIW